MNLKPLSIDKSMLRGFFVYIYNPLIHEILPHRQKELIIIKGTVILSVQGLQERRSYEDINLYRVPIETSRSRY